MDEPTVVMLKVMHDQNVENFRVIRETCQGMRDDLKAHADTDTAYWKKIDQAEGQISFLKWLSGGLSISGLIAWLYTHFGK